jgi:outer membrane cobalamin receptor
LRRSLFLLTGLVLFASTLFAQQPATGSPGRIGGVVLSDAGQPLTSAAVTIRNATDSATVAGGMTSKDGRFRIDGLPIGRYLVRITHIGFKPHNVVNVEVTAAEPSAELGQMKLSVAAIDVAGVEATATKSPVIVEADRTIHDTKDMVAAKGGKAVDVLRSVPELEVDMNGKVTMRGNQSVEIHINGRKAPLRGDALTNYLQQMPGDRISKVEVIPNPSAKHDPEGSGGIVNIVMKDNADLGLSGSVSLNGSSRMHRGGGARINYQKGRFTLFTGGNFNFHDNTSSNYDLRRNLLASPITLFEQNGSSDNSGYWNGVDLTTEFKVGKQAHFWLNGSTWGNGSENANLTAYGIMTDDRALLDSYDRFNRSEWSWRSGDVSTGFKQVFQPMKHELTIDLRRYFGGSANENRIRKTLADATAPIELTYTDLDQDNAETSLSADYTRPLGKGKMDLGARLAGRGNDYDNATEIFADETVTEPTSEARNFYQYDERFNSIYVTGSHPYKKFGFTAGLRAEFATTEFVLPTTGETFSNEYHTLFPSATVSYDFGKGLTARVNYGKRIGRPWPDILNPYVPVTDPLNRRVGNPHLKPNYTHSITADLSKVGTRGTLRLAPYYRTTVNQWMDIKRVDSAGVSTVTWENVARVQTFGTSLTASLRPTPTGRLSGSTTFNMFRELRDAGNLTSDYINAATRWSANANAQFKIDDNTNVQTNFNYNPPRTLLQGKMSAMIWNSIGLRRQFMEKKASLNLNVNDPFDLSRWNFTTNDRTHEQLSKTTWKNRQASLSFTYNWGKPPEQQSRRQSQEGGNNAETTQIR